MLRYHPESTAPPEQPTASHEPKLFTWVANNGNGARHASDTAPFSLWDDHEHDFRSPTPEETKWILDAFGAESVTYSWPDIIIETCHLPNPVSPFDGGMCCGDVHPCRIQLALLDNEHRLQQPEAA